MKEGWQTALSLERRVSGEREQVSAAIVSRDTRREEGKKNVREWRWRDGVDINIFQ